MNTVRISIDDDAMKGPIKGLADRFDFSQETQVDVATKESKLRAMFEELLSCWKDNLEGRSEFVKAYEEG